MRARERLHHLNKFPSINSKSDPCQGETDLFLGFKVRLLRTVVKVICDRFVYLVPPGNHVFAPGIATGRDFVEEALNSLVEGETVVKLGYRRRTVVDRSVRHIADCERERTVRER